ncbi:hypothetical protein NDU88_000820 [Pleurodeles waltl]|uniref:Uncharacterized protein n=1 Tax=Pleurodeles waltl TaxID=8319 RepID=A0AAV7V6G8_PLEWA|nr:hypothetical protein NDU88_000820 [Pleurodeles waltl]
MALPGAQHPLQGRPLCPGLWPTQCLKNIPRARARALHTVYAKTAAIMYAKTAAIMYAKTAIMHLKPGQNTSSGKSGNYVIGGKTLRKEQ